jgi:hypothetical protein
MARGLAPGVAALDERATTLWVAALLLFGVCDLVTTAVGYPLATVAEAGPLAAPLVGEYGVPALVPLKVATLGTGYLLWRAVPRPQAVGAPLALAVVGGLVTAWNAAVIVDALGLLG